MKNTEQGVLGNYERNIIELKSKLQQLSFIIPKKIAEDRTFSGWTFERTIEKELEEELKAKDIQYAITQSFKLASLCREKKSRGIVDLVVENRQNIILIEIKRSGLYNKIAEATYQRYYDIIRDYNHNNHENYSYLYISGKEEYKPYKEIARRVFGQENAYFLDEIGSWDNFIKRIVFLLKDRK